jgi:hypothetical protein
MEKRKRRRFTAEYKAEAVKRLEESGKGLQQVADELGGKSAVPVVSPTLKARGGRRKVPPAKETSP